MQPLTSYQHAHDAAYERYSNRDDAIDREADAIIADKTRLMEVIEAMLIDTEVPIVELLAYHYANQCSLPPQWVKDGRFAELTHKNIWPSIYEAVMKEARCVVDERDADRGD